MIHSKISLLFIFTIILIAFASNIAWATNQDSIDAKRDSLLLLIKQSTDNNRKAQLYNIIATSYLKDNDYVPTEKYASLAYDLAMQNNYQFGIAESLYNQSYILAMTGEHEQSMQVMDRVFTIIEKIATDTVSLDLKARTLEVKAWVLQKSVEYYEAISCLNEAFEIYDGLGKSEDSQLLLLNIGYTHMKVGDYDLASEYINKAKNLYLQINRYKNLVICYNNLGYILMKKEAYAQALSEYRKGAKIAEEQNINYSYPEIIYGSGFCLMKLGEEEDALMNLKKAGKMYEENKNESYEAYCNLFIAKIQFSQTQNQNLLPEMQKAYQIAEKYGDMELMQFSAEALAEAHASLGMFKAAYEQTKLSSRLQDSISNDELLLKLRRIDSKNRFERSQKKIENEKKEELLNAKLDYQTNISYLLLGFMVFFLLGAGLLYHAYKTTSQVKEKLVINNKTLRKTEERLSESNKEMQKYIDLNVELEQFAYIASHDIKAPLRTIQGFASVLKKKFYHRAEESEKTFFDFIEKGVKSLNLLVDDLLEYSKSNTKILHIERFDFNDVLEEVVQILDFSITQVNGTIETTNCDFSVNADQIKIKQILQNLLSNALKFKDENRDPIVQVNAREDADFFIISVKDNGIGIAEEHFDEVFQKFARLNTQTKYEGTGLGLSICAKYTKEHKGKISISRNDDFGVTFTFSISKHLPLPKEEDSLVEVSSKHI